MSMDELLEEGREPFKKVSVEEVRRDWFNRVLYFRREYLNSKEQFRLLQEDTQRYDIIAWFDPNQRIYFYEKHEKKRSGL